MSSRTVATSDLRVAGGLMLAAAAVWPLLPHGAGLPCLLRATTGIPCPLCGMTTSVVATTHLRLGDALAANPAGLVLVGLTIALLVAPKVRSVRLPSAAVPLALVAMWIFELHRFGRW